MANLKSIIKKAQETLSMRFITPPRKIKCSKTFGGFTLAEILITLTIIGVIAALTIPNLMAKYQEQVTVSKVKKFYSVMSNAVQLAIRENGSIDTWGMQSPTDFMTPIIKNLKVQKDCSTKLNSGCIPNGTYYLNGTFWANYDNNNYSGGYYKIMLQDGSVLWARWDNSAICDAYERNRCGVFWYDTNGLKKPNTMGKDTFHFDVYRDRIEPHISTPDDCNKNDTGWSCAKHIILNGNMDYLHK